MDIHEKNTVFRNKTKLWQQKIAKRQLAACATISFFLEDLNEKNNFLEVMLCFMGHLEKEMARCIP